MAAGAILLPTIVPNAQATMMLATSVPVIEIASQIALSLERSEGSTPGRNHACAGDGMWP